MNIYLHNPKPPAITCLQINIEPWMSTKSHESPKKMPETPKIINANASL